MPWDRGSPNPALEETLIKKRGVIGTAVDTTGEEKKRKKALVPGCGRGVDVLLLASFGYDAIGVEYSQSAVEVCNREAKENGDKYPVRDPEVGRGEVKFLVGDFFKDEWLKSAGLELGQFELIYDYTVRIPFLFLYCSFYLYGNKVMWKHRSDERNSIDSIGEI